MAELTRKQAGKSTEMIPLGSGSSRIPCGACRYLRRRCINGCIFAPHFSPERGTAEFASLHKLFGASNVTKLLTQLPEDRRQVAIETLIYEGQARSADPVFGCVKNIMSLQQEVLTLRRELAMAQNQLLSNRQMVPNTLPGPVQQVQPVYPNGTSANNRANDHQNVSSSQPPFDPFQFLNF